MRLKQECRQGKNYILKEGLEAMMQQNLRVPKSEHYLNKQPRIQPNENSHHKNNSIDEHIMHSEPNIYLTIQ